MDVATPPLNIPAAVIDWVRDIFKQVNARSAATLSRIPNTFETTLDHALIAHLAEFAAPFRFPSDWVVTLDMHFLGGRYWGHWEGADIGMLVIFRRKATILATKIALLQSKRLYPNEIENAVDMHPVDYMVGFGRLLKSDSEYRSHVKRRTFHFSPGSKYRALAYKDEQYSEILKYSQAVPVHYLLYNPLDIPHSVQVPASAALATIPEMKVGCRVIKADHLDSKLGAVKLRKSSSPTFQQVAGTPLDPNFWTLHNFVADLVIGCQEGDLAGTNPFEDEALFRVFNLRRWPNIRSHLGDDRRSSGGMKAMQARKRFAQSHVEFAMAEQTHRFLFGKAVRMTRIAARSQICDIGAGGRGTSTSENARSERSKIPFGGN